MVAEQIPQGAITTEKLATTTATMEVLLQKNLLPHIYCQNQKLQKIVVQPIVQRFLAARLLFISLLNVDKEA